MKEAIEKSGKLSDYISRDDAMCMLEKHACREQWEGSRAKAKGIRIAKEIIASIPSANVTERTEQKNEDQNV